MSHRHYPAHAVMNATSAQNLQPRPFPGHLCLCPARGLNRLLLLLSSLLLVGLTHPASAALSAYEPFNYPTGAFANNTPGTGSGFAGNWTVTGSPAIVAGLTYATNGVLPVSNNSLSSPSGSGRQYVSFGSPLTGGGTKWISFLFNQAGNNGGNYCGIYFPNGGTGLYFGYGSGPYSGTQGYLCLGTIGTAGNVVQNATSKVNSYLGTYGAALLVVLRIDYNTPIDTVSVYLNPPANSATAPASANMTTSTFSVGTITGIGLQNPGGGNPIIFDELRVGDSYGDVVGYAITAPPGTPTGLSATGGNAVVNLSWNAVSGASGYQVKRSTSSGAETTLASVAAAGYADTAVVNGTTYFYKVSATNNIGESGVSAEVSATPMAPPPPPPIVAAITRGTGIRWFASNGVSYQVQWAGALLGTNTVWNNLGGTITGNGATNVVFDPAGSPHRFYQVLGIQ